MEKARQHSAVESPWLRKAMIGSYLSMIALAPLTLISVFFGRVAFVFATAFFTAMVIRLVLSLIWSWNRREIREYGVRIVGRDTRPIGYWSIMAFGIVAAAIAMCFVAVNLWVISNP
jgi:hypothetical protein